MKRILLLIAIAFSLTGNATSPVKDFSANTTEMVKLAKPGGVCATACGANAQICIMFCHGLQCAVCTLAYERCMANCGL